MSAHTTLSESFCKELIKHALFDEAVKLVKDTYKLEIEANQSKNEIKIKADGLQLLELVGDLLASWLERKKKKMGNSIEDRIKAIKKNPLLDISGGHVQWVFWGNFASELLLDMNYSKVVEKLKHLLVNIKPDKNAKLLYITCKCEVYENVKETMENVKTLVTSGQAESDKSQKSDIKNSSQISDSKSKGSTDDKEKEIPVTDGKRGSDLESTATCLVSLSKMSSHTMLTKSFCQDLTKHKLFDEAVKLVKDTYKLKVEANQSNNQFMIIANGIEILELTEKLLESWLDSKKKKKGNSIDDRIKAAKENPLLDISEGRVIWVFWGNMASKLLSAEIYAKVEKLKGSSDEIKPDKKDGKLYITCNFEDFMDVKTKVEDVKRLLTSNQAGADKSLKADSKTSSQICDSKSKGSKDGSETKTPVTDDKSTYHFESTATNLVSLSKMSAHTTLSESFCKELIKHALFDEAVKLVKDTYKLEIEANQSKNEIKIKADGLQLLELVGDLLASWLERKKKKMGNSIEDRIKAIKKNPLLDISGGHVQWVFWGNFASELLLDMNYSKVVEKLKHLLVNIKPDKNAKLLYITCKCEVYENVKETMENVKTLVTSGQAESDKSQKSDIKNSSQISDSKSKGSTDDKEKEIPVTDGKRGSDLESTATCLVSLSKMSSHTMLTKSFCQDLTKHKLFDEAVKLVKDTYKLKVEANQSNNQFMIIANGIEILELTEKLLESWLDSKKKKKGNSIDDRIKAAKENPLLDISEGRVIWVFWGNMASKLLSAEIYAKVEKLKGSSDEIKPDKKDGKLYITCNFEDFMDVKTKVEDVKRLLTSNQAGADKSLKADSKTSSQICDSKSKGSKDGSETKTPVTDDKSTYHFESTATNLVAQHKDVRFFSKELCLLPQCIETFPNLTYLEYCKSFGRIISDIPVPHMENVKTLVTSGQAVSDKSQKSDIKNSSQISDSKSTGKEKETPVSDGKSGTHLESKATSLVSLSKMSSHTVLTKSFCQDLTKHKLFDEAVKLVKDTYKLKVEANQSNNQFMIIANGIEILELTEKLLESWLDSKKKKKGNSIDDRIKAAK
ncbi:hypothetical protein CHS0354_017694 [Potamilus streckersoni]|uniref:Uncharacterized protein n=1 Tax=Potamilus streckersoni TaxID=2493646 RepID=A0AAE0S8E3_9BIVA|nr:hypothetical protein CHS0354_017694 [Potamilus streckersoni]